MNYFLQVAVTSSSEKDTHDDVFTASNDPPDAANQNSWFSSFAELMPSVKLTFPFSDVRINILNLNNFSLQILSVSLQNLQSFILFVLFEIHLTFTIYEISNLVF